MRALFNLSSARPENAPRATATIRHASERLKGAVVLAVVLFAVNSSAGIAVMYSGRQQPLVSCVLLTGFLLFAVANSIVFASGQVKPCTFSASLYLGYGLLLPAIYQTRTGYFPWAYAPVGSRYLLPASILTLLSVVAFYTGTLSVAKSRQRPTATRPSEERAVQLSQVGMWPALLVTLMSFGVCAASYLTYGAAAFTETRGTANALIMEAGLDLSQVGLGLTLPRGLAIGSLALAGLYVSTYPRRSLPRTALLFAIASNILVNWPTSLARYILVAMIGTAILALWTPRMAWYYRAVFFLMPLAVYVLFPILGAYNRSEVIDLQLSFSGMSYFESGDLDGFQSTVNAVEYVDAHGLLLGRALSTAALFFVPRAVWTDKLEASGALVSESVGYEFLNISMPLQAELFLDGSFILSVVGMYLVGRCAAVCDRGYVLGIVRAPLTANLSVLLAGFFPILLRGSLLGVIASFASALVVPLLWWTVTRVLMPAASPAPAGLWRAAGGRVGRDS